MNAKGSLWHTLLLAGALLGSSPAMAAEPIEARIASLEKELAELKALVKA